MSCEYHGKSKTKLYKVWIDMRARCNRPSHHSYGRYGGRGIYVCSEWESFTIFYEWAYSHGYREGLEIDRINNDSGYNPDNCRWCTRKVNDNNRSTCRFIEYNGETHTLKEWCEILSIKYDTACKRLNKLGWTVEQTLSKR